jgi:hypothetical protein
VNGEGRPEGRPTYAGPDANQIVDTVARARVTAIDRQCRNARRAEQAIPLVTYYAGQPLQAVPLAEYLAEGWWAA